MFAEAIDNDETGERDLAQTGVTIFHGRLDVVGFLVGLSLCVRSREAPAPSVAGGRCPSDGEKFFAGVGSGVLPY